METVSSAVKTPGERRSDRDVDVPVLLSVRIDQINAPANVEHKGAGRYSNPESMS
jgi:hypothetical protein